MADFRRELRGVPRRGARRRRAATMVTAPRRPRPAPRRREAAGAAAAPQRGAPSVSSLVGRRLAVCRRSRIADPARAATATSPGRDLGTGGGAPIALSGVARVRPASARATAGEHNEATCRSRPTAIPATYWETEHYRARPRRSASRASASCSTPDARSTVAPRDGDERHTRLHGGDPGGRQRRRAVPRRLELADGRRRRRRSTSTMSRRDYLVVWITTSAAGGSAHVNEVTAVLDAPAPSRPVVVRLGRCSPPRRSLHRSRGRSALGGSCIGVSPTIGLGRWASAPAC